LESVLWLDTEGTQPILIERLEALGIPLEKIKFPFPLGDGEPSDILQDLQLDRDGWRIFEKAMRRVQRQLVVIDSLGGSHTLQEKESHIGALMKAIEILGRETGNAFLIIHHIRKAGPGRLRPINLDDVRGHGSINANTRVVLAIEPNDLDNPDGQKKLKFLKSNLSKPARPMGLYLEHKGRIRWGPLEQVEVKKGVPEKCADWLRSVLAKGPVLSDEVEGMAAREGFRTGALD
jgi:hypothetical protein